MLSGKLIQQIEGHWEQIAAHVLEDLRRDPRLVHLRKLPEAEARDIARAIVKNLGRCLTGGDLAEMESRYETIGRLRACESIPLAECVLGLQLVKVRMLEYVRGQGFAQTPLDIYDEEQLEHRVGEFFDDLAYHIVHGYEEAWHRMAGAAIAAVR